MKKLKSPNEILNFLKENAKILTLNDLVKFLIVGTSKPSETIRKKEEYVKRLLNLMRLCEAYVDTVDKYPMTKNGIDSEIKEILWAEKKITKNDFQTLSLWKRIRAYLNT